MADNAIEGGATSAWQEAVIDKLPPAEALAGVEREQRRLVQYGVRQDELDREIVEIRASLKASVAGAATRRQAELADDMIDTLSEQTVITAPIDDQSEFEASVAGLKAATVNEAACKRLTCTAAGLTTESGARRMAPWMDAKPCKEISKV